MNYYILNTYKIKVIQKAKLNNNNNIDNNKKEKKKKKEIKKITKGENRILFE